MIIDVGVAVTWCVVVWCVDMYAGMRCGDDVIYVAVCRVSSLITYRIRCYTCM